MVKLNKRKFFRNAVLFMALTMGTITSAKSSDFRQHTKNLSDSLHTMVVDGKHENYARLKRDVKQFEIILRKDAELDSIFRHSDGYHDAETFARCYLESIEIYEELDSLMSGDKHKVLKNSKKIISKFAQLVRFASYFERKVKTHNNHMIKSEFHSFNKSIAVLMIKTIDSIQETITSDLLHSVPRHIEEAHVIGDGFALDVYECFHYMIRYLPDETHKVKKFYSHWKSHIDHTLNEYESRIKNLRKNLNNGKYTPQQIELNQKYIAEELNRIKRFRNLLHQLNL